MEKTALYNLKILDFTTLLPGPFATMYLADMGADVLKITAPNKTDLVYEYGAKEETTNISATALWLNRNKRSITLDLKKKKSVEVVKKLIKEYDIVIEQFRPGVMNKLGLSYEALKKINPKLIYCSITGYGQSGDYKDKAGHDINYLARSGILSLSGSRENGPELLNIQLGDLAGGALHSVIGILSAVNYRNMTGEGQYIDISMTDCLIPFNTFEGSDYLLTNKLSQRQNTVFNGRGLYDIYRTRDNEYITVGSLEPKFLTRFAEAVDVEELKESGADFDSSRLKQKIKDIISSKTLAEWEKIFSSLDCCVEKVMDFEEVFEKDSHNKTRRITVNVPLGQKSIRQIAMPIKFSQTKPVYKFAGKKIGQDNQEILSGLGLSKEEICEVCN